MSEATNFLFPNGVSDDLEKYSAYTAMLTLAIIPIWIGSHRSARKLLKAEEEENQAEVMTKEDAYMFPFVASGVLFSLYLVFSYVPEEYLSVVITGYFSVIGVLALTNTVRPLFVPLFPSWMTESPFELNLSQRVMKEVKDDDDGEEKEEEAEEEEEEESSKKKTKAASKEGKASKKAVAKETEEKVEVKENIFLISVDYVDFICLVASIGIAVWYVCTKNWIANNIFGLSFSINGIEMLCLGNIQIGCILLGGLFVYDIFWVFGTDVMVTVAKSFDAPIKLLFPKDFLINGIFGKQFTMLGLGDIVIPGIFVALLLRFDFKRALDKLLKKKGAKNLSAETISKTPVNKTYFYAGYISYILGLVSTFIVMHVFQHAQVGIYCYRFC